MLVVVPAALALLVVSSAADCERLLPRFRASCVDPQTLITLPAPGDWLVDLTNTLSAETRREINSIAKSVNDAGNGKIAVVLVGEVLGEKPRPYALALFNRWGIGNKERDDGVLLFVSLRNKTVDILLGYGLEGPKEEAESHRLIVEELVPRFRKGKNAAAIVAGVQGLAKLLSEARQRKGAN